MERWSGKVAVVTGASAGIGLATAKLLVNHKLIVVGLARRKEKMEKEMESIEGSGKFYPRQCDVSSEVDVAETFDWIKNNLGTINILVNNAGIIKPSTIEDATVETLQQVINVNVMGLLYCTKEAVKLMKANGEDAHIVNINSIAGHKVPNTPGIHINVYPATKFAVRAISETCMNELLGTKIRVSNISPGYVKTEIFDAGELDISGFGGIPGLESEDVANAIVHCISVPQNVLISELTIKPLGERF